MWPRGLVVGLQIADGNVSSPAKTVSWPGLACDALRCGEAAFLRKELVRFDNEENGALLRLEPVLR
jgi:hypothetical protein